MKLLGVLIMASWLCMARAEIDWNDMAIIASEEGCAAFLGNVSFFDQSNTQTPNNIELTVIQHESTFNCTSNTSQKLNIVFDKNTGYNKEMISDLTLDFKISANKLYWELESAYITLNQDGNNTVPLIYMGAPYGMETPVDYSFACTRTVFLLNTGVKKGPSQRINFYIEKLQLQPINVGVANETDYTFGRVNYCQGFFSSGIWMAISASLILTFILAFGISLLFNVRPLDRFDDPKGKPLNIGAEK